MPHTRLHNPDMARYDPDTGTPVPRLCLAHQLQADDATGLDVHPTREETPKPQ